MSCAASVAVRPSGLSPTGRGREGFRARRPCSATTVAGSVAKTASTARRSRPLEVSQRKATGTRISLSPEVRVTIWSRVGRPTECSQHGIVKVTEGRDTLDRQDLEVEPSVAVSSLRRGRGPRPPGTGRTPCPDCACGFAPWGSPSALACVPTLVEIGQAGIQPISKKVVAKVAMIDD